MNNDHRPDPDVLLAQAAAEGFFREGNLTALRELALRFTAERVDRDLEDIRKARRVSSPWKTNARLLVGVGPTPYPESLIRWTRRASRRHGCPWLAVWVEGTQPLTAPEQDLLARGLGLARRLGAEVVHATGDDVAATLLKMARERNVSQIVVGKANRRSRWKPTLADRIIDGSGDIDVCVVRPVIGRPSNRPEMPRRGFATGTLQEYGIAFGITAVLTALCWQLEPVVGYTATKRLQRLVDGLLQMTRLESQIVEPQLEWCDVNELVESAIKGGGGGGFPRARRRCLCPEP